MCSHPRAGYFKVTTAAGWPHCLEGCPDCKKNLRGLGAWVPHSEVPGKVGDLPEWPEASGQSKQPTLF